MSSRKMDMSSKQINVRRFCASIVDPGQTHARYELSFVGTPEGTFLFQYLQEKKLKQKELERKSKQ